jgi:hypothetical protein
MEIQNAGLGEHKCVLVQSVTLTVELIDQRQDTVSMCRCQHTAVVSGWKCQCQRASRALF